MKKLIIISIFFIAQFSSCQTIVPITTLNPPNGSYSKDLDDKYLPYLGTWEGIIDNKKYTFIFTKFTKHYTVWPNGESFYSDDFGAKLKVTDLLTNTIIYDNTAITTYDDYKIWGAYPMHGICHFLFFDEVSPCKVDLEFNLRNVAGQPTQLKYSNFSFSEGVFLWECTQYAKATDKPVILPKVEFILNKI